MGETSLLILRREKRGFEPSKSIFGLAWQQCGCRTKFPPSDSDGHRNRAFGTLALSAILAPKPFRLIRGRFICEKEKEKKRGRGQPTVNTIRERENDGGGVFLFGVHGEARRRPSAITATGGDGVCWAVFGHQFFGFRRVKVSDSEGIRGSLIFLAFVLTERTNFDYFVESWAVLQRHFQILAKRPKVALLQFLYSMLLTKNMFYRPLNQRLQLRSQVYPVATELRWNGAARCSPEARGKALTPCKYPRLAPRARHSPFGLTATGLKRDQIFIGDISTLYKSGKTTVDVKVDTYSNVSTKVTVTDILPTTKATLSFRVPDHKSGKLDVQYFHPHAAIDSSIGLHPSPLLEFSAAIGSKNFSLGGDVGFDTTSASFTKYNAGISLNKSDFSAALMLTDKGQALKASYIHSLDPLNETMVAAEMTHKFSTSENSFTIGSSHVLDPVTLMKTRFSNKGKAAMLFQREWRPKSLVTLSAEYDSKAIDSSPKIGLAIALKP
ncbi:mitochondrial outer membrane protein porin 4 [Cucumis melo var. makuwa]|uniref:Mitochondrial outer membrane protein porin 4 n=1 Tax=Cucumis melo var. makuwa TaxID=1194695 RepID=A0A5A7UU72_CUCMM|nr:mitochondrial outer membrane protein porin 4 [Cucumis melo var. makuwa]